MMNELSRKNNKMVEVAKTEEIPSGKIKHIEVNGIEMIVANIDDKYMQLMTGVVIQVHVFRWGP